MTSQEIHAFLERIHSKDPTTCSHCSKAAEYAVRIGSRLGLDEEELQQLRIAAILHDIGKLKVPTEILMKPSALTPEEYEVIKRHPEWGAEIVAEGRWDNFDYLQISELIRYHHERYDGNGYPFGRPGHSIPLLAQIISIADAFDAMTSDRPYRKAMSAEQAAEILAGERGKQFHPELVDVFIDCIGVGTVQN